MIELMTAKEMLTRLKAGEDPFDLSIEKWERIRNALNMGYEISLHDCKSDTCALCEIHCDDYDYLWCGGNCVQGILPCPLKSCMGNSAWIHFTDDMTPTNAQRMIDAIEKARCPEE